MHKHTHNPITMSKISVKMYVIQFSEVPIATVILQVLSFRCNVPIFMNGGVLIQSAGSLVSAFAVRSLRVAPYECARGRLLASPTVRMTEEG